MSLCFFSPGCGSHARQTLWLLALALCAFPSSSRGAETAFTYQGRLNAGGQPASGLYDFRFILYSAEVGGNQVGGIVNIPSVTVINGLFATVLDFGPGAFDGTARWLDISVRTNNGAGFTPLVPRQTLSPTPHAMFSDRAAQAQTAETLSGQLPASQISGTIANANLADGSVTWPKLAPGTLSRLTNPSGSATNLFINSSGNVGINTLNPVYRLDVAGPLRSTYLTVQGGTELLGDLTSTENMYVEGNGRFRGTVFAGSSTFSTTNVLEVYGSARVRTNLVVGGDLVVADDLVIGNRGNVRSDSTTQLKVGFTSGNFAVNAASGAGLDIPFVLPAFPAGTTSTQVRVLIAQFLPDAGTGLGFQQFTLTVYAIDIANRLCTIRVHNAGSSFATIDGTLYLMTVGPAD
jgi:hypothetical protein